MTPLRALAELGRPPRILALGAHPDDIEIGCGGTLLQLLARHRDAQVLWAVFTSTAQRAEEARRSAATFLEGAGRQEVVVGDHRDGFLPYRGAEVKDAFEALKHRFDPDLVLTHTREDRHQDHGLVSELTWNTWRNHLILEYEIPKYDGDLGQPNLYVPLSSGILERKVRLILQNFPSQAGKAWFTEDLFRGLARIRGMECAAPERHAEAFHCRKAVLL